MVKKNADFNRTTQNVQIFREIPFFQAAEWKVNND